jgi:ATP-dependent protease ClpP protease subunit
LQIETRHRTQAARIAHTILMAGEPRKALAEAVVTHYLVCQPSEAMTRLIIVGVASDISYIMQTCSLYKRCLRQVLSRVCYPMN